LSFLTSQANELNGGQSYHEYRANCPVYLLHSVFSLAVSTAVECDDWRGLLLSSGPSGCDRRSVLQEQPVTNDFNQILQEDSPPAF
jgi:hypothetical protein